MREGTREDFNRFCVYSTHIRYLEAGDGIFPIAVLEDYLRFFSNRPILPRVQSINFQIGPESCLPYILRALTPAENQPAARASALRTLTIYRNTSVDPSEEDGEILARDLAAFQHSNGELGGGLEAFQDFLPFPTRGRYEHIPAGCQFQASIQDAFALPPPETTTHAPAHRLRRLGVTHELREFPVFFRRVAGMRALEHLKIAVAHDDTWVAEKQEEEDDSGEVHVGSKLPLKDLRPSYEGVQHSAGSLEIEGIWSELSTAVNLCAPPSAATQFRALRLLYYLNSLWPTQAEALRTLDLLADIVPPDYLESLFIDLLDNGEDVPNCVNAGMEEALKADAFRPLLRYHQMVHLHLELPYNILLDLDFVHTLGAAMGDTLRHFVLLRRLTQWEEDDYRPGLTAGDLPTIAGTILPRLETLGLDVSYDGVLSVSTNERDSPVAPLSLRTLYVGTITLSEEHILPVARFLKEHLLGLQYLYHHEKYEDECPWPRIVKENGYDDGFNGAWGGLPWGY
jgi:hypothetical protein